MSAAGGLWITTNAVAGSDPSTNFLGVYELTPSVTADVPNSTKYYNNLTRLFLRVREPVVLGATVKATYGGKMVADFDIRSRGTADTSSMQRSDLRLLWETNNTLLKASYYRGRLYYPGTDLGSDEWITVFLSANKTQIAVIQDSGPIYVSENAGLAWREIARAGEYELKLSTSALGSEIVAVVSLPQAPPPASAKLVHKMATDNWYSVASGATGSQLVLTGGPSQSAPALSIRPSGNTIVLSWDASFSGFRLQTSSDPSTAEWADVATPLSVVNGQYQMSVPASSANKFFRLKLPGSPVPTPLTPASPERD
ncbi:MAG TPA: hypothetical protein VJA21_11000 [Verrucomicrobiae bacterium]